ncbi:MAG: RlmE family RNA methyltransferase [Planctomycetota bacterium]|jgi:23S rRNA (uridine2552-2'-O)-methyltransferase|nr:RlmE family RNA methyltransferase [Planctomycetota bacterium]
MRELHDRYFRQAKREGKLARSYYKLAAIDRREKLFTPQVKNIIDLGAAPGSWLEYILEQTASRPVPAIICAADLKVIAKKFKPSVHFIQRDINEIPLDAFAPFCDKFDLVLSDMAPNTTGVKIVDQARSLELCEVAARFAAQNLRAGGAFVAKIFAGVATPDFVARLRTHFAEVKTYKPDASRDESFEFYVIGKDFQGINN